MPVIILGTILPAKNESRVEVSSLSEDSSTSPFKLFDMPLSPARPTAPFPSPQPNKAIMTLTKTRQKLMDS